MAPASGLEIWRTDGEGKQVLACRTLKSRRHSARLRLFKRYGPAASNRVSRGQEPLHSRWPVPSHYPPRINCSSSPPTVRNPIAEAQPAPHTKGPHSRQTHHNDPNLFDFATFLISQPLPRRPNPREGFVSFLTCICQKVMARPCQRGFPYLGWLPTPRSPRILPTQKKENALGSPVCRFLSD